MVRGTTPNVPICKPVGEKHTIDSLLNVGKTIYHKTKNIANVSANNIETSIGYDFLVHLPDLQKRYGNLQKEIKTLYNFENLPLITLFRAEIIGQPIEQHSLIKARKSWPNFQPNKYDWLRSVKLPTEFGIKEAELLGIIFADSIDNNCDNNVLILNGGKNHFEFYETVVKPRVVQTFNLPAPVQHAKQIKHLIRLNKSYGPYTFTAPQIQMCSQALRTWLDKDLKFQNLSEILKYLPERRQQIALFEGYIAGKAGIYATRPERCEINEANISKLDSVIELANSLGFDAHKSNPYNGKNANGPEYTSYRTHIYKLDEVHLLNPHHRKILSRTC